MFFQVSGIADPLTKLSSLLSSGWAELCPPLVPTWWHFHWTTDGNIIDWNITQLFCINFFGLRLFYWQLWQLFIFSIDSDYYHPWLADFTDVRTDVYTVSKLDWCLSQIHMRFISDLKKYIILIWFTRKFEFLLFDFTWSEIDGV